MKKGKICFAFLNKHVLEFLSPPQCTSEQFCWEFYYLSHERQMRGLNIVKYNTEIWYKEVIFIKRWYFCLLDYWVIQPDEDSGFNDDCSSVAYGEDSSSPVQITAYKTKSWGCFKSSKNDEEKPKEQQENVRGKNEWPTRKGNFLQRATKKIIGKTKRIFGNLKPEEVKKPASVQQPETKLKENHTAQVNIILPANSSTSINEDLVDDGKVNFFRADPLRSPFRESRSSASRRESRESLGESRNSFQRTDLQRCSIRGPRDSFFRESRDAFPRDALRVSERQTMLRVLFDFQACDNDDISVRRGELVRVLNKDDDDWWWVENVHRDQGFVPRSFLWPCGCYGE